MPIRSKAQWRKLAAARPDILREWQREAPVRYEDLPERVGPKRARGDRVSAAIHGHTKRKRQRR